eukprot:m51a1_g8006 hypothetical protein (394) ;mRNA; r:163159-164635
MDVSPLTWTTQVAATLALGLNPRLGERSPLLGLHADVIARVCAALLEDYAAMPAEALAALRLGLARGLVGEDAARAALGALAEGFWWPALALPAPPLRALARRLAGALRRLPRCSPAVALFLARLAATPGLPAALASAARDNRDGSAADDRSGSDGSDGSDEDDDDEGGAWLRLQGLAGDGEPLPLAAELQRCAEARDAGLLERIVGRPAGPGAAWSPAEVRSLVAAARALCAWAVAEPAGSFVWRALAEALRRVLAQTPAPVVASLARELSAALRRLRNVEVFARQGRCERCAVAGVHEVALRYGGTCGACCWRGELRRYAEWLAATARSPCGPRCCELSDAAVQRALLWSFVGGFPYAPRGPGSLPPAAASAAPAPPAAQQAEVIDLDDDD